LLIRANGLRRGTCFQAKAAGNAAALRRLVDRAFVRIAGARVQPLLELDHIERRPASPLVRDIVVAAHDLAHLGLGQRPPADLHHLAAADVAHPAILQDAQQEVRGDVAVLVLHHTTGALAAVSALKVLTKHSCVCASIAPAEGLGGSKKPWPGGEVEK
jgi:hypothetical protein